MLISLWMVVWLLGIKVYSVESQNIDKSLHCLPINTACLGTKYFYIYCDFNC